MGMEWDGKRASKNAGVSGGMSSCAFLLRQVCTGTWTGSCGEEQDERDELARLSLWPLPEEKPY